MTPHTHSAEGWNHPHVFLGAAHERNERRTWLVIALTVVMMVAEIVGGTLLGSMALTADGWHMLTHAGALSISAYAYTYARKHKNDNRFAFGTGKLGDLGGYTSAVVLAVVALLIAYESVNRLITPVPIVFGEALAIAVLGLIVNFVCMKLLGGDHGHSHGHDHDHDHDHAHDHEHEHTPAADNNMRSAYFHVMADAATSVAAIIALALGWIYGWTWVDALMGIAGSIVIGVWSVGLLRDSGRVLLDMTPDEELAKGIRQKLEVNGDLITDLHMWQVGTGHYSAIIAILSDAPQPPAAYKEKLSAFDRLSHVTVEVHKCPQA